MEPLWRTACVIAHCSGSSRVSPLERHRVRPCLEILEPRVVLSTYTWTGSGNDGLWNDSNNWQPTPSGTKGPADGSAVIFPAAGGASETTYIEIGNADVSAITIQGSNSNYTFETEPGASGTLTLDNNATITTSTGANLAFSGDLNLIESGTVTEGGDGTVVVGEQGSPALSLAQYTVATGTLQLPETTEMQGTLITLDTTAMLLLGSAGNGTQSTIGSLNGDGTVEIAGDDSILNIDTPQNEYDVFTGDFVGTGTIDMEGAGSLTIRNVSQGPDAGGPLRLEVQSGTLLVSGTANLQGDFFDDALDVQSGATFGGSGTVNFSGEAEFEDGSTLFAVLGLGISTQLIAEDSDSPFQIGSQNTTLSVSVAPGYEPEKQDVFPPIISAADEISGQFTGVSETDNGSSTTDNVAFAVNYVPDGLDDNNFSTVTAEPQASATTTQLTSSADSAYCGVPITLTATVATRTSDVTVGTVTFEQGYKILAQDVPLNSAGIATSGPITNLTVGSLPITAVYNGYDKNGVNDLSSAGSITETINPCTTSTTLSSSANPASYGQSIMFSAAVQNEVSSSTGAPTGAVQFTIDGKAYGNSVPVLAGSGNTSTASILVAALAVDGSPHTVSADYVNTDGNYVNSPSNQINQSVSPDATATVVTSSASPSSYGQAVMFTATVSNKSSSGAGTPTGAVQFYIDGKAYGNSVPVVAGSGNTSTASILVADLAVDGSPHTVSADYVNTDGNYVDSPSNQINQSVSPDVTATVVTSSATPSSYGQSVMFTATVSNKSSSGAGTPTGSIQFYIDGKAYGNSVPVVAGSGNTSTASIPDADLAVGGSPHTVSADYVNTDGNYVNSPSNQINQSVSPDVTATVVTSSATPSSYGQSVMFAATVNNKSSSGAGTPTGSIQFYIDGKAYGNSVPVVAGSGNTSTASIPDADLAVGGSPHSVSADYVNTDGNYVNSPSNQITQSITADATATKLTSSPNPSLPDQSVTLSATVSNTSSTGTGAPTGEVQFYVDGAPYGQPVPVVAGSANSSMVSIPDAALAVNGSPHAIFADFTNTDGNYADSTSNQINQNVGADATSTTVTSGAGPSFYGQSVTFLATVSNVSSGGMGAPTGSVQFYIDGASYLSPVPLMAASGNTSTATISDAALVPGGPHTVYAVFTNTDGNYVSSQSNQINQNVIADATATTLTSSSGTSLPGQSVRFLATVTNTSTSGAPTGSVQFYVDGAEYQAPVALIAGNGNTSTAIISDAALVLGSAHTVFAVYSNVDGEYSAASPVSNSLTQSVSQYTTKMVGLIPVPLPRRKKHAKQTYELEAVVMNSTPGFATIYPVGTVVFSLKNKPVGRPQPVVNGIAYLLIGTVNPTKKKYMATFLGNSEFASAPSSVPLT